jgi:hypothetical protein
LLASSVDIDIRKPDQQLEHASRAIVTTNPDPIHSVVPSSCSSSREAPINSQSLPPFDSIARPEFVSISESSAVNQVPKRRKLLSTPKQVLVNTHIASTSDATLPPTYCSLRPSSAYSPKSSRAASTATSSGHGSAQQFQLKAKQALVKAVQPDALNSGHAQSIPRIAPTKTNSSIVLVTQTKSTASSLSPGIVDDSKSNSTFQSLSSSSVKLNQNSKLLQSDSRSANDHENTDDDLVLKAKIRGPSGSKNRLTSRDFRHQQFNANPLSDLLPIQVIKPLKSIRPDSRSCILCPVGGDSGTVSNLTRCIWTRF